jgi:hypothetical protein
MIEGQQPPVPKKRRPTNYMLYQEEKLRQAQSSTKKIELPEIYGEELSRTLLQTKFLSTHNSYITVKQIGGTLSRNLVLKQLKHLEEFPICIELDVVNNGTEIKLDHATAKKTEGGELKLTEELNFLHNYLKTMGKTFPLVISIDTTQLPLSTTALKVGTGAARAAEKAAKKLADAKLAAAKLAAATKIVTVVKKNRRLSSQGAGGEAIDRLNELVHNCKFNTKPTELGTKKFFDYNNYFLDRLFDILEDFATERTYYSIFLDEHKKNKTKILANLDNNKKYPTDDIFIQNYLGIRENTQNKKTFEYLEELITTFKNGSMIVNTPLKELMNTVLIRYKSPPSSFEYTDGKILPLGSVHLNGHYNTKSFHISTNQEISSIEIYPNQITRVFPSFSFGEGDLIEADRLIELKL